MTSRSPSSPEQVTLLPTPLSSLVSSHVTCCLVSPAKVHLHFKYAHQVYRMILPVYLEGVKGAQCRVAPTDTYLSPSFLLTLLLGHFASPRYTYPSFLTEIRHLLVLPPLLVLLLPFVHNITVFTTYIRILIESGDIITSAMILLTQLLDVLHVSSG